MKEIVSYGGGTQSTALILMALNGEYGLPRPDFGVYADTGGEPEFINQYVRYFIDYVKEKYDFDIFIVKNPKHTLVEALNLRNTKGGEKRFRTLLPFYTLMPDGSKGIMNRKCTRDFKVDPQKRFIKTKLTKGEKYRKWYGISFDERTRMKISTDKNCINYYPLVDNFIQRIDSINYVNKMGLKQPQRSACTFCPFHSNKYWQWLKDHHNGEFRKVCDLEVKIKSLSEQDPSLKSKLFLHNGMKLLSETVFTDENQLNMFPELIDECGGECGI